MRSTGCKKTPRIKWDAFYKSEHDSAHLHLSSYLEDQRTTNRLKGKDIYQIRTVGEIIHLHDCISVVLWSLSKHVCKSDYL